MGLNICVSCQQPIKHGKGRRITVSMAWIHIECPCEYVVIAVVSPDRLRETIEKGSKP